MSEEISRERYPLDERIAIYLISHLSLHTEEEWKPLVPITYEKLDPGVLYCGFEREPLLVHKEAENGVGYRRNITREDIERKVGKFIKLEPFCYLRKEEGFWLTSEGEIYQASNEDSINDPDKTLVARLDKD